MEDNMWTEEAVRLYFEGYTAKEAILTVLKYKEEEKGLMNNGISENKRDVML